MYNSASDHTSLHFYADLSLTGIGVILQNIFVTVFRHQGKKKKKTGKSHFAKCYIIAPSIRLQGAQFPTKRLKMGGKQN